MIESPLSLTRDAAGVAHLSIPASIPAALTFVAPGITDPRAVTKLVIGDEFQTTYTADGTVTVNMDLSKVASRYASQAGFRSAMSNGNPQTCVEQTLGSGKVLGQDYIASCSTFLTKLEQYQTLYLVIKTTNTGPVSLSIDTLQVEQVLDRRSQPIPPGALIPGMYHIWNDGANWIIADSL